MVRLPKTKNAEIWVSWAEMVVRADGDPSPSFISEAASESCADPHAAWGMLVNVIREKIALMSGVRQVSDFLGYTGGSIDSCLADLDRLAMTWACTLAYGDL